MDGTKDTKIASIDLSTGGITSETITPLLRKEYMGGGGINTKILYDSEAMYHDALSEKNVLIFGTGPGVGNGLVAGNRAAITARSPLTDLFGDSNIGGNFNVRLRAVGYDHLVFRGKAQHPVYLWIKKNGDMELCDASDIWGTYTHDVTDILLERHGKTSEVACIGPAGENLVRYACVIMSKTHAAGRMGMGCVMGSKNLKAIVVEKNVCKPWIYDEKEYMKIRKSWMDNCKISITTLLGKVYGTVFLVEINNKSGELPIRNYQTGYDERAKNLYATPFLAEHQVKKVPCYSCPVGCSKAFEVREGRFKGEKGERIEFGAIAGLGPCVGIFDWPSVIHLKLLADNIGVDAIEVGAAVSIVLECLQRGIITPNDLDGRSVEFGNVDDVEYLMHKMAKREGIGDIIAEGPYRAAILLNAEDYAFCINKATTGLKTPGHLPRTMEYLTSTRGGDHLKCYPFTMQFGGYGVAKKVFNFKNPQKQERKPDKNGRVVWWHENYKNILDSLGVCLFAMQGLPSMGVGFYDDFEKVMNALYGLNITEEEILKTAERIYQLQNSFNIICGLELKDYKFPERKKDSGIDEEYIKHTTLSIRDDPGMLPEYFEYRGLTKEGKPTKARFIELGLEEYIDKAGAVEKDNVRSISDLLKDVKITVKFSAFKKFMINKSMKIMDKVSKKRFESEQKKYFKEKEQLVNQGKAVENHE